MTDATAESDTAPGRDDWEFDQTPSTLGVAATVVAGLVSVAATTASLYAAPVALAGLVLLVLGVSRGSRRIHNYGTAALFLGVLIAGAMGATAGTALLAFAGAIVAWDAGENAISLGRQLGSRAPTRRAAAVHVAATAAVAGVVALFTMVIYDLSRAGQPTTAVALLLVAALVFIWLLDD